MKLLITIFLLLLALEVMAAVPTEEGLLQNLNNANIPGNLITVKAIVQPGTTVRNITGTESPRLDYYKFIISLEKPNIISLLQIAYSNGQMLNAQIRDVKYIPDLVLAIKKEKSPEKGLFYGLFSMLTTNRSAGIEAFLEKSGIQIVKNKNLLNEEKMKLLKTYRNYLATNKGKGEANSPLNPADPQNKAKVVELFKANTFLRSKNIELVKVENEFFWRADWKSAQGYFSNEERRLRKFEYTIADSQIKVEASDYILFNGTNELPKVINIKDTKGLLSKIQIIGLDTKNNREKKLNEHYEDVRKFQPTNPESAYSFLF